MREIKMEVGGGEMRESFKGAERRTGAGSLIEISGGGRRSKHTSRLRETNSPIDRRGT